VGVGREQNFTYIAALQPSIAFIVDIRRGNLQLHLMYKALFELSTDRAGFVSRLFSRPRPDALGTAATPADIFDAYANISSSEALYENNLHAIEDQLVSVHGFALSSDDLRGIEYIYHAFYAFGPGINYSSTETGNANLGYRPTYADLMVATDTAGDARSFLASEGSFATVKALQTRNLSCPSSATLRAEAVRAVGAYLRRTMRRCPRSTCRTSSNISGSSASGDRSAAMRRGCRSTRPACSSGPAAAAATRAERRSPRSSRPSRSKSRDATAGHERAPFCGTIRRQRGDRRDRGVFFSTMALRSLRSLR
jgi:hypothetical protein